MKLAEEFARWTSGKWVSTAHQGRFHNHVRRLDSLSPKTCCYLVKFSVPSVSSVLLLKESLSEAQRQGPETQADEASLSRR